MPTFVGRLRVIKNLLSSEIFAVLARLNYMVYMIHCLVLFWYLNDMRQANYVNSLNQWFFSISTTVISFIFAVPFTLLCEVPFMNIEKYVLFPSKPRPKRGSIKAVDNEAGEGNMKVKKYYALSEEGETMDSKQKLIS
jgi:peptidoglycan/LPS O-acetylase OafA/YrhL